MDVEMAEKLMGAMLLIAVWTNSNGFVWNIHLLPCGARNYLVMDGS